MDKKERQIDALKMFRTLVKKNVKNLKASDFRIGNMVSFTYVAKDKDKVWDKTPLVFVLWRTNTYTLGLNFHWVPKKVRYILLDFILKKNKRNIQNGKPLQIDYREIRPLIEKLKLKAVVRLYINRRMSRKGIVIPQEHMRKAVELPAENFIGMTAEQAYTLMVKKSKTKKKKR